MSGKIAVVILAGGEGRRIGGGKPLRRFGGERLIDRALRRARAWSDLVVVGVRSRGQITSLDAPIIIDTPNIAGPLGGLVSALLFGVKSGREFVLTIPADMPFLPRNLLDRLLAEIGQRCCAIAGSGGHAHPVCGLWRTSALDHVGGYLTSEKRSLKGFAARIGCQEVEWQSQPVDPFFNINTDKDLAQALQHAGN
ncbi:MAG: molybdenum cofactor guanylyltransferase [Myxococcales bacterium]|nr:molybdenum cofactor guanylyltransferase [Sphingomicrobium sp.]